MVAEPALFPSGRTANKSAVQDHINKKMKDPFDNTKECKEIVINYYAKEVIEALNKVKRKINNQEGGAENSQVDTEMYHLNRLVEANKNAILLRKKVENAQKSADIANVKYNDYKKKYETYKSKYTSTIRKLEEEKASLVEISRLFNQQEGPNNEIVLLRNQLNRSQQTNIELQKMLNDK